MAEDDRVKIPLDDSVRSTKIGEAEAVVTWKSGLETRYPKEEYRRDDDCTHCSSPVRSPEKFKYDGLCTHCYPEQVLGVPAVVADSYGSYEWQFPVTHTRNDQDPYNRRPFRSDRYNNIFGVGDIVRHNQIDVKIGRRQVSYSPEGVVLELHQYEPSRDNTYFGWKTIFGAKVDFEEPLGQKFVIASRVEALTCDHADIKISPNSEPEPVDAKISGPLSEGLKRVMENPLAAAIWMSYRMNHLVESREVERLQELALTVAKDFEELDIVDNRVPLWLKSRMVHPFTIDQAQAIVLAPYLTGKKMASFRVFIPTEAA